MRTFKKLIRKLYHLIWFLSAFLLFSKNAFALTQCGSQGILYDNKTMPLIVFLGNGPSDGYEIQNYAFSNSYQSALNWGFNSFQQLCQVGSGSIPSTFTYITFRVTNYTFLKGNIYSIVFSFTDSNPAWNIDITSSSNQTLTWRKILSAKADPRDKIMYLTIVFEATENYSGTTTFYFYTSPINTLTFLGNTEFFYTPYITSVPSVSDNTTQLNNIRSLQETTLNSVQQVQQQLSGVQDSIDDVNDTLNDSSVDSSSNTLQSLQNSLPTNSVISDLLLLPVTMLQAIVNSIGGTCASFSLGSLYGTNLVMPCIDLPHYLGNTIWTFIDLVFSGMFVLVIRKKFIQIWENITNLKGGGNEVD